MAYALMKYGKGVQFLLRLLIAGNFAYPFWRNREKSYWYPCVVRGLVADIAMDISNGHIDWPELLVTRKVGEVGLV